MILSLNKRMRSLAEGRRPNPDDLHAILAARRRDELRSVFATAAGIRAAQVGNRVYLRGLVEVSNFCMKDCWYCGIRRGNRRVRRYQLGKEDILAATSRAHAGNYGSIVLQAGERQDKAFIGFIEEVIADIRKQSRGLLGITLSLGEQSRETLERWFEAGAHRYLLRIETSSRSLYRIIHPHDHDFDERLACLQRLQEIGYQVGTGVMIGLPGQNSEDLVNDLLFFAEMDIDMIGMGPYLPHRDTPLPGAGSIDPATQLELGLKMIAAARILLADVNIAATTALQTLAEDGLEQGLRAGANVFMPNMTETRYRRSYQLYDNKPWLGEDAGPFLTRLEHRLQRAGMTIGYGERGDSLHYRRRSSARTCPTSPDARAGYRRPDIQTSRLPVEGAGI